MKISTADEQGRQLVLAQGSSELPKVLAWVWQWAWYKCIKVTLISEVRKRLVWGEFKEHTFSPSKALYFPKCPPRDIPDDRAV